MTTTTLTWSATGADSNPQSTFGTNPQGFIQLLHQHLTARALASDFPWTVASFETTTAPWYVVLKRKSGGPGRIIFVGVSSAPGLTYNPQFNTYNWTTFGVRAAYFPAATSDVPANILATSGDVFTTPSGNTGMTAVFVGYSTGTNVMSSWASEDGIVIRYGAVASTSNVWVIGDMLEDSDTNAVPVCFYNTGWTTVASIASAGLVTAGGYVNLSGTFAHVGSGWVMGSDVATQMRNSGAKNVVFFPHSIACATQEMTKIYGYKFRQICFGPASLAAYEQLFSTGPVLSAISTAPAATSGHPWLTNFKV